MLSAVSKRAIYPVVRKYYVGVPAHIFSCNKSVNRIYNVPKRTLFSLSNFSSKLSALVSPTTNGKEEPKREEVLEKEEEKEQEGEGENVRIELNKGFNGEDEEVVTFFMDALTGNIPGLINGKKFASSKDSYGNSVLHWAADGGSVEAIDYIINTLKIDIEAKNYNGYTPLFFAASSNPAAVSALVERGASTETEVHGASIIHYAAFCETAEPLRILVEKYKMDVERRDRNGYTPYFCAKNKDIVQFLHDSGANISAVSNNGMQPIHVVPRTASPEVVELMHKLGADINAKFTNNFTPLVLVMKWENLEMGKKLIELGADVNIMPEEDTTNLLHYVPTADWAELLVKAGANINLLDKNNWSPLFHAVGNDDVLDKLIELGADLELEDTSGLTPIFIAVLNDCKNSVCSLFKAGAKTISKSKNSLIHTAALNDKHDMLETIISLGVPINSLNSKGRTALQITCMDAPDAIESRKTLLKLGADVNFPLVNGHKVIHFCATPEAVRDIVEAGGDVNQTENEGISPLILATRNGKLDAAREMIRLGAKVNHRTATNRLVINYCTNNVDSVKLLLEHGSEYKDVDGEGYSLLHMAASYGTDLDVLSYLVESGTIVLEEKQKTWGDTALHCAAKVDNVPAIERLVELGANINSLQAENCTPLHLAATKGSTAAVKRLLELGAEVDGRSEDNKTPLHRAGNEEIARLLLNAGARRDLKDDDGETAADACLRRKGIKLPESKFHGGIIRTRTRPNKKPTKQSQL